MKKSAYNYYLDLFQKYHKVMRTNFSEKKFLNWCEKNNKETAEIKLFLLELKSNNKEEAKTQVGCGYCHLEKTCKKRDRVTNFAKQGCEDYKHSLNCL